MGDRGAHPSRVQIEALIDFLEQNPDLARGYRKHLGARERMNAKWKGIALKLNSMGGGATKDWKQWSKYFRDKKSATKKKAARRAAARRRTGGGAETVLLSAIEEKIVALLGEGYAIGSGPCIHPFTTRRDSAPPSPPQRSSPISMPMMQTASEAVTSRRDSGYPAVPSASQPQRSSPMPSTLCRVMYSSSTTSMIADGQTPPNPQGPCSPILPGGNLRRSRRVPSISMRRASPVPSPPGRTAPEEFQTSIEAMRRTPPSQSRRSQLTALSDRLLQMEQERLEMNRQHMRRQEYFERRMVAAITSVGKSSGIVTTARITHATPAALYAHAPSRYWEDDSRVPPTVRKDCKDIAMQLVENEPGRSMNVIMGGGRRHFLPNVTPDPEHRNREGRRLDGRNLAEDWAREKKRRRLRAQYIHSKQQLSSLDPRSVDYLLGLFEYSHMEFNVERGSLHDTEEGGSSGAPVKADDPSLADMTRAALSILSRNDKGFFLLIEGGRIDHAHHYNNPYRALDETLELETALLAALERVNPAETLIVVTADHGHVMTFGGQATPRGHPVLGADTVVSDIDGLRYSTLLYGTGPGHSEPRALPLNTSSATPEADAVHAAAAPRQWATHGAEDVPVYALGPMATVLFTGVVEQSYIPHAIAYAACLAHHAKRCQEKDSFTQIPPTIPKCVPPEVSSVSAPDERPSETASGRRVVVASSVMSDERATRAAAPVTAPLITQCGLIWTVFYVLKQLTRVTFFG